jgi:hypothetical protein
MNGNKDVVTKSAKPKATQKAAPVKAVKSKTVKETKIPF